MIEYKVNKATKEDLFLHLQKCDNQFLPKLSSRINVKDYANKLFKKAITFEAWSSDKLVGLVAVYFNDEKSKIGYISNISVILNFENKGIASSLLNQTKTFANKKAFYVLLLEVNKQNINAISFYEKHDFELTSEKLELLIMKCELKKE